MIDFSQSTRQTVKWHGDGGRTSTCILGFN